MPELLHGGRAVVSHRDDDPFTRRERRNLGARQAEGRTFDERRVTHGERPAAVGDLREERSHALGHPFGASAARVLTGEPADHRMLGELAAGSPQDPRGGFGGPSGGGDEDRRIGMTAEPADILGLCSPLIGEAVGTRIAHRMSAELEGSHTALRSVRGWDGTFAYDAASMRSLHRTLAVIAILAVLAAACTKSSSKAGATLPPTKSPTSSPSAVTFVSGHFAYDFAGVKATFVMTGHTAQLKVQNGAGTQIGPPRIVVIDQKNQHVQGQITGAKPIANGADATFSVTFPDTIDQNTVGLIQISFGDVAYGLLAPAA
jgi:hypothetical protein